MDFCSKQFVNFGAKKCFLLTADTASNHFQQTTLNPMVALGYFLTLHTINQAPQQYWRDLTLALVFHIVDDILAKEDNDMILKSDTGYFLSQVKRNLEKIIEESKDQGTSSNTKTIIHAEEGLLSIKQIQKNLEDNNRSEG
ncbi:hypothetical protein G6F46_010755 [Rhizopus delemar]|nr:hypothetical protein G6F36_014522 [Rhizopus arrhizus]KAG1442163.1 hypothetical protein G6F55_013048 [Rhizopus delemar]KAG1487233.1 hypothetical protein G6F54_012785 [Rhizopus delemar]KAG1492898.1 hypothetical protein G6F53_012852 [Rhizopus delemar]KAG1496446.1 hypothetical protein G6F52_012935 [Rhizopus delemar]